MRWKQFITHLMVAAWMLVGMWFLSLLPASFLNQAANWIFILCVLLTIVLGCLTLKRKYFVLIGLCLLKTSLCMAQEAEVCAASFDSSLEEGHWCMYSTLVEKYESELCSYTHSFNPSKAKSEEAFLELQDHVNMADRIIQAYGDLDKARRSTIGQNCKLLTPEERNANLNVRLKKLQSNNNAVCCAWAMQTLNQIYNAQYAERQVQTVPMILADSKTQCWPCDVVYLLIVLVNTMVFRSAPAMAAAGMFFLEWVFLFWIVVKIGMLLLNRDARGKAYSGAQFFQELFIRFICVAVAALALSGTAAKYNQFSNNSSAYTDFGKDSSMLSKAYQEIINPVFELISTAGIQITKTLLDGQESFYTDVTRAVREAAYKASLQKIDYCDAGARLTVNPIHQYLTQPDHLAESNLNITGQDRFIGTDLTLNMLCLSQLAFKGLSPIAAIGSVFISYSIKNAELLLPLPGRIPLMPQIFYGILLNVVCWIIGIIVAFRLIDIVLRLAIVVILCPVFIATAAFPISRSYAVKAVKFFISALMGLIEVALAVAMIVPFFYKVISGDNEEELLQAIVAPSSSNYVPNLYSFFEKGSFLLVIYIFGVLWLSIYILKGVQKFFKEVFSVTAVGTMAGKGSLNSAQLNIRRAVGQTYDAAQEVKLNSQNFKYGFSKKMENGTLSQISGFAGRQAGKLGGHTAVTAKKFYEGSGMKTAYNWGKNGVQKIGNGLTTGAQNKGIDLIKAGANMSKAGYGLGAIVGIPTMLLGSALWTGGTATKVAGKTTAAIGRSAAYATKQASAFTKNQTKKALYQFFHPDQK